jgi:hypothetical protein
VSSTTSPISAAVVVSRGELRQWHVRALQRAAAAGAIRLDSVIVVPAPVRARREWLLNVLSLADAFVAVASGSRRPRLWNRCRPDRVWPGIHIRTCPTWTGWTTQQKGWTLVIDLSGASDRGWLREHSQIGVLELRLGGTNRVDDILNALPVRNHTVELSAVLMKATATLGVAASVVAVRESSHLLANLDMILARAAVLLARAIVRTTRHGDDCPPQRQLSRSRVATPLPVSSSAAVVGSMARLYARSAGRHLRSEAETWFLAFRECRTQFVANAEAFSPHGFTRIMPERRHFYADPCVFRHCGIDHVFFEDYSTSTGKGVIAWMQYLSPGRFSAPQTVLDRPYHLSYPFVFEHEGAVYMIPETYDVRRIEMYRARHFPRSWERVAIVMDDIEAVDSTLLQHDGRWWLFTTIGEAQSSTEDELFAFFADSPHGPWRPHAANPVKSDIRSARSAGRFFRRHGRLIRPAQNCSRRYGGSLALCEVLELTPAAYREQVIEEIGPEWLPGNTALHTLSFSERVEFIDGCATTSRRQSVWRGGDRRVPTTSDEARDGWVATGHCPDLTGS